MFSIIYKNIGVFNTKSLVIRNIGTIMVLSNKEERKLKEEGNKGIENK